MRMQVMYNNVFQYQTANVNNEKPAVTFAPNFSVEAGLQRGSMVSTEDNIGISFCTDYHTLRVHLLSCTPRNLP